MATSYALSGPLGQRVRAQAAEMRAVVDRRGGSNLRVFGSVARGEELAQSDVDLLVDLAPGTSLIGLCQMELELEDLLGASVDLVPSEALKPHVAAAVRADLVPV